MTTMNGRRGLEARGLLASAIVVVVALAILFAHKVSAQAGAQGYWRTLPYLMPSNINPVHMALMNNGRVLIVAGSGNLPSDTTFESIVWDPQTDSFLAGQTWPWDMFCNAMVNLPDGRVFVNGGNLAYDPFKGERRNAVYDPATNLFANVENMAHGRWYPTTTVLGDGRVMTFSGLTETGGTNTAVEIYNPETGWSPEYPAGWTPPLYPRLHLLTNGAVGYFGSGRGTRTFNPATHAWSSIIANTNYTGSRTYGTSVLLPLSPSDGFKSRVMIFGGGNPATATTEIIDMSASTPQWQYGPSMSQPRIEMNATILPNGKVLALGGSKNDEDASTASLNADLYDPTANTISSAGSNAYPRLYHSNALLLPDATVLLAGGNPQRGTVEQHIEVYSPAYLFNADGTPASRPTVTGVSPSPLSVAYGGTFQVQTPDANIASVVLMRPGAPTHAFDMEQRLVKLVFTPGSGVLSVTAPPNGNVAPPGYYLLFILNASGVPSIGKFMYLSSSAVANQPPTAVIASPATNVTINAGQAVSFGGTGTDSDGNVTGYSWTFPGGSPASSSAQNPVVTYSTPGGYVASLTVTDNGGATSSPATRSITVADFTLSAAPTTQTVLPAASANYAVTVNPGTGFAGNVSFSVSGLPSGATASFSPTSVNTSGTTTLTVATIATTPAGNYPLVITGGTGVFTRTVNVTLVVSGTLSMSVSPPSATIKKGGSFNYTVTITGASGPVSLSVSGLPKFATSRFNPSSLTGSGTATLNVSTNKNVATGTSTLTVTATSGSVARSTSVTLITQ